MQAYCLIDNNGYWYKKWNEPSSGGKRLSGKLPVRKPDGTTLKVSYNTKGEPINRDDAVVFANGSSTSNGRELLNKTTIAEGLKLAQKYWRTKAKPLKEKTIIAYTKDIEAIAPHLPKYINDAELSDIVNLGIELDTLLGKTFTATSRIGYIKSLSTFCRALVKCGRLKTNPAIGYEFATETPVVEPYTEKQILNLLESAKVLDKLREDRKQNPVHYYTLLMFAFQTGLRLDEYCNLRWEHLDWKNQQYNIFKDSSFDPKYSKSRTVYIPTLSFNLLKEIKKAEGYIFCRPNGNHWNNKLNHDVIKKIFRNIELLEHQEDDLHHIRKTHASYRLACGQPPYRLMYDLGHSSVDTLQKHYTRRVSNPSPKMKEIFGDYR